MQNQIQIFNFQDKNIRTQIIDNEPFFCVKDVCDILQIKNARDAVSRLEKEDVVLTDTLTNGGVQKVLFVNEAGLYALIFQSKKEEAKHFKKWVFKEVLPSIRKTGSYQKPMTQEEQVIFLAKQILIASEEKNRLVIENEKQAETIKEYIQIDESKTYTEVAKILHLRPRGFISKLRELQYISRYNNIPYQKYINSGWFEIKKTKRIIYDAVKHFESYLITKKGFEYFSKKIEDGLFDSVKV